MSRPKKSLGQNFLQDTNVARKIVRALHLERDDCVLEIGPGKGALTSLLLDEVHAMRAVELDKDLAHRLAETYGKKLTIFVQDVLSVDLRSIAAVSGRKLRIVGNIPYNITSPILFWIFDSCDVVSDSTLMMQREVAQRLVAKPRTKEYGILSIFAQYYSAPKLLFTVSPESFYPVPDVVSTVVSLDFSAQREPRAKEEGVFRAIVRGTFGKRRKTLRNGLKSLEIPDKTLLLLSIDANRRPEELSVAEFVGLANEVTSRGVHPSFTNREGHHGR